jgi:ferredoxin
MGKYIVKFERQGCISEASCTTVHPERWIMDNTDARARLIGGVEKENGVFEIECDESELEKFKNATLICPVAIITVFDKNTGRKLYP